MKAMYATANRVPMMNSFTHGKVLEGLL